MALQRIFEPIKIGNVEVKNRVVRTAHGTHFAADQLTDAFVAYHEARAKGGCGLTILEIASVHPSSVGTVRNFNDGIIEGYRTLMKAVRPHGMKVFQQLHHGGVNFPGLDGVAWSSSHIPGAFGGVSHKMDKSDIEAVIAAFAAAAVRCREGGLDGVEIHGAHGYLFHQFLSPLANDRDDEYGGSLENRSRLLFDTLRAVRKATGDDFVVGVRLSATEAPVGVTVEDNLAVLQKLEQEKLINFVDVSLGDYYRMGTMNATMETPTGYELPSSGRVTSVASVPSIVAGRFRTLEEADQVLRDGIADMVSMVRAQIADPELVNKTQAGHPERVRPCIACNQGCIGGVMRGGQLGCLVNPATGFERTLSEDLIVKTSSAKKVLVIGGGPAGLEAARVSALAGHKVILAEASSRLGGTLDIARRAPVMHTVGDILQWLESEIFRLGVEVRLNTFMDSDMVRQEKADVVIVATGAIPRKDGMQSMVPWIKVSGVDMPHVFTTAELLTAPTKPVGKTALVLDDVGHLETICAIDTLHQMGMSVTLVTRHTQVAPYVESTQRGVAAHERFDDGKFRILPRSVLTNIRKGECDIQALHGKRKETVQADVVVLITPNLPLDEIHAELRHEMDIRKIGDAAAPRDAQAAIAEGRRTAMAIA